MCVCRCRCIIYPICNWNFVPKMPRVPGAKDEKDPKEVSVGGAARRLRKNKQFVVASWWPELFLVHFS